MLFNNFALLFAEMTVYFGVMLALFRARRFIGIGGLFCALGTLHFLATYLGSTFFLKMPFGLGVSPGGTVIYTGFLALIMLTYVCEGTFVARQPVYGLLLGSFLLTMVAALLGFEHTRLPFSRPADIAFLNRMAAIMLWGTLLLMVETTFLFRLFDALLERLGNRMWPALWLSMAAACTFDQLFYFPAIHFGMGVPLEVGIGNWLGKLISSAFYALLIATYLRHGEGMRSTITPTARAIRLSKASVRHDQETGAFHRSRFDTLLEDLLSVSITTGRPLTLLLVAIELGAVRARDREAASALLRQMVEAVSAGLRTGDYVVRIDTDLIAVLAPGLPHQAAFHVAAMMRQRIDASGSGRCDTIPAYAIGIATAPADGESVTRLLSAAERRVYAARAQGAGQAVGAFEG